MKAISPDHRIITFSSSVEERAAIDKIVAQVPSYMGCGDLVRDAVRAYLRVVLARIRAEAAFLDKCDAV